MLIYDKFSYHINKITATNNIHPIDKYDILRLNDMGADPFTDGVHTTSSPPWLENLFSRNG